jgi:hypothetical protein
MLSSSFIYLFIYGDLAMIPLILVICMARFKATFALTMHRAKPSLREGMQSWLDTL